MRAMLAYAGVSACLLVLAAGGLSLLLDPAGSRSVWLAAVVAWAVQVASFGMLVVAAGDGGRFMVGWAGGMALRMAAVVAMAVWVVRFGGLPAAPLLLSLVGFVFVLVLVEPLFLRMMKRG